MAISSCSYPYQMKTKDLISIQCKKKNKKKKKKKEENKDSNNRLILNHKIFVVAFFSFFFVYCCWIIASVRGFRWTFANVNPVKMQPSFTTHLCLMPHATCLMPHVYHIFMWLYSCTLHTTPYNFFFFRCRNLSKSILHRGSHTFFLSAHVRKINVRPHSKLTIVIVLSGGNLYKIYKYRVESYIISVVQSQLWGWFSGIRLFSIIFLNRNKNPNLFFDFFNWRHDILSHKVCICLIVPICEAKVLVDVLVEIVRPAFGYFSIVSCVSVRILCRVQLMIEQFLSIFDQQIISSGYCFTWNSDTKTNCCCFFWCWWFYCFPQT